MQEIAVFDFDGVLLDSADRIATGFRGTTRDEQRKWDRANLPYLTQTSDPIIRYCELAKKLHHRGLRILCLTARDDTYHEITRDWLNGHVGDWVELVMRTDDGAHSDSEFKVHAINKITAENPDSKITLFVDDNPTVAQAVVQLNITVIEASA